MEKLAKIYFDSFESFDFVGLSKFFFEIGYVILYVLALFKVTIVPFTYLSYFLVGSFGTVGIILSYLFYSI